MGWSRTLSLIRCCGGSAVGTLTHSKRKLSFAKMPSGLKPFAISNIAEGKKLSLSFVKTSCNRKIKQLGDKLDLRCSGFLP